MIRYAITQLAQGVAGAAGRPRHHGGLQERMHTSHVPKMGMENAPDGIRYVFPTLVCFYRVSSHGRSCALCCPWLALLIAQPQAEPAPAPYDDHTPSLTRTRIFMFGFGYPDRR